MSAGTGKAEKITITAEKGRLSEEDIERMVREAEEYADEDKKVKERIDARNGLESYLYNFPARAGRISAGRPTPTFWGLAHPRLRPRRPPPHP